MGEHPPTHKKSCPPDLTRQRNEPLYFCFHDSRMSAHDNDDTADAGVPSFLPTFSTLPLGPLENAVMFLREGDVGQLLRTNKDMHLSAVDSNEFWHERCCDTFGRYLHCIEVCSSCMLGTIVSGTAHTSLNANQLGSARTVLVVLHLVWGQRGSFTMKNVTSLLIVCMCSMQAAQVVRKHLDFCGFGVPSFFRRRIRVRCKHGFVHIASIWQISRWQRAISFFRFFFLDSLVSTRYLRPPFEDCVSFPSFIGVGCSVHAVARQG